MGMQVLPDITRRIGIVVGVLFVALAPFASSSHAESFADAKRQFNTEPRRVRPNHLLLQTNYVPVSDRSYAYHLSSQFIRLARDGALFRIKGTKSGTDFDIILETQTKTRVTVRVEKDRLAPGTTDEVAGKVLAELFEFGDPPAYVRFIGNQASHKVHLGGCNHLPPDSLREGFEQLAEARDRGFVPCPICFTTENIPPVEGYTALRRHAIEDTRQLKIVYPPSTNAVLQQRVRELGQQLVGRFPIPTKNFDYEFGVLESEIPTAYAFPTGYVYATTALVNSIEDSLELAFVLAHEIAHCELRRTDKDVSDYGLAKDYVPVLSQEWQRRFQFREIEADFLALLCVNSIHGSASARWPAQAILGKVDGLDDDIRGEEGPLFETHPPLQERLRIFSQDHFIPATDTGRRYQGIGEDGTNLMTARYIGRYERAEPEIWGNVNQLGERSVIQADYFFLVEMSDLVSEPAVMSAVSFQTDNGKKMRLDYQPLSLKLMPGGAAVCRLSGPSAKGTWRDLTSLDLWICKDVKYWVRAQ